MERAITATEAIVMPIDPLAERQRPGRDPIAYRRSLPVTGAAKLLA